MNYSYLPNETFSERLARVSAESKREREERDEAHRTMMRQGRLQREHDATVHTCLPTPAQIEQGRLMSKALADDYTESQKRGWSTE